MTSITLSAPAKVSLFLKILNKRKDGYHNILTLFERISLADVIKITAIPKGIEISSDKFITANPKDNLVYKAAELILKHRRLNRGKEGKKREYRGVRIRVEKNIPIAAGLGGGSSDAASILIGINKLYNLRLKEKQLMKLAKRLGADVPFFILKAPFASGTRRGDELKKVNCNKIFWHLIIYPGFKLATKDIYEAFDLLIPRQSSGSNPELLPKGLTTKREDVKIHFSVRSSLDSRSLEGILYNDLEETAISKKKVLRSIIERLAYHLGRKAIVSGSGPSVFCLYGRRKEAVAAREKLFRCVPANERKRWQIFIAGTESSK